jgi:hypothetical protein
LYPGQKKQQHNTELVGWFVACFFKSHAAQQRHWFGQLAIPHIKQQVVCPCSHTIKHGSKVKTKRLSFVASFPIHFEPRFEPLGWLEPSQFLTRRVVDMGFVFPCPPAGLSRDGPAADERVSRGCCGGAVPIGHRSHFLKILLVDLNMSGVLQQQGSWIKPDLLKLIRSDAYVTRATAPRPSPRVQIVRARSTQKQIYVSDSWTGMNLRI